MARVRLAGPADGYLASTGRESNAKHARRQGQRTRGM